MLTMPRPNTKKRIVDTARIMFNEKSFGAVTTAALAERLAMTEGNLWYHFNSKRDLLKAVTELFLPVVEKRLSLRPSVEPVLESYAEMLVMFTQEIHDFQFLYRDQADYGEHTKLLLSKLPKIFDKTFEQFNVFHEEMTRQGLMRDDKMQLSALTEASIISFRFNSEFWREWGTDKSSAEVAKKATNLHLRIFRTIMADNASDQLAELIDHFEHQDPVN